jgi:hypothetical protein
MSEQAPDRKPESGKVGLIQTAGSVMAAAFGVSSSGKRERDFRHGKASTFIIAGVVFTMLFVLSIYGVVKLVLHAAGQ